MKFPPFIKSFKFKSIEEFRLISLNNKIIILAYSIIILITVISIITLFWKFKSLSKEIVNTKNYLLEKQNNNIDEEFMDIDGYFNKIKHLKTAWKQFEKTIRLIKISAAGEEKNKYLATIESEYFFNENLLENKYNYRLYNYFPQALIAIGIFGTFLGLVLGLNGLNLETSETTQESIRILIDGVKLSFVTSLYGVSHSILLTFYKRWLLGNIENKIYSLAGIINSLFPKNTQDDGVKELHFELERQTSSLESLATNLAEVLDEKISNSMEKNFKPLLEKLVDSVEASQNNNQEVINSILENTGEIISSATKDELENLTTSLNGVTQRNEKLFNNLGNSIDKIEDLISNQEKIINQTNKSASNVKETNSSILEISDELENVMQGFSNFSEKQQTSFNDFSKMLEDMNDYMEQQSKMNKMISLTFEENLKVSNAQKEIYQDLNSTSKNLNTFNTQFSSTLKKLDNNLNKFEELSANINSNYTDTIEKVDSHYNKINDSLEIATNKFDKAVNTLQEEIITNLNDINDKYNKITSELNEFSNNSSKIIDRFEQFSQVEKSTQEIWSSYQDSFDDLNNEINSGVNDYTNAVRKRTNELLSDYDNQLGSTIEKFYDLIERLNDSIDEMNDFLYEWDNQQRRN
jgi:ABC-type transporter Mla subunit MlaD